MILFERIERSHLALRTKLKFVLSKLKAEVMVVYSTWFGYRKREVSQTAHQIADALFEVSAK